MNQRSFLFLNSLDLREKLLLDAQLGVALAPDKAVGELVLFCDMAFRLGLCRFHELDEGVGVDLLLASFLLLLNLIFAFLKDEEVGDAGAVNNLLQRLVKVALAFEVLGAH